LFQEISMNTGVANGSGEREAIQVALPSLRYLKDQKNSGTPLNEESSDSD
jgi:hypothetical protein